MLGNDCIVFKTLTHWFRIWIKILPDTVFSPFWKQTLHGLPVIWHFTHSSEFLRYWDRSSSRYFMTLRCNPRGLKIWTQFRTSRCSLNSNWNLHLLLVLYNCLMESISSFFKTRYNRCWILLFFCHVHWGFGILFSSPFILNLFTEALFIIVSILH